MLKKLVLFAAVAALIGALNVAPALASHTRICDDGEILTGSYARVLVPEGETCTLDDATVAGDVLVRAGGGVSVLGTSIGDDLRAKEPAYIRVDCSAPCSTNDDLTEIVDDVRIRGGSGVPAGFPANYICNGTTVGDDLKVSDSTAPWQIGGGFCDAINDGGITVGDGVDLDRNAASVKVVNSEVGGDLEADQNTDAVVIDDNEVIGDVEADKNTGGVSINNNDIGDDLDCDDNNPTPTGGNNTVGDDKRDQCANL